MTHHDDLQKHKGYRRIIPSMTALLQFESVARHSSFTLAAKELGVTQAAVSKQIKVLEDNIGAQLFHRGYRTIGLTEYGELLFSIISDSLQRIAGALDHFTQGSDRHELVLGSTASFSQLRIMPRLPALADMLPRIQLRLATQMFIGDLRAREYDLDIRFGDGKWEDGISILLFEEEVFPVCSPAWLARNPMPMTLDDLAVAGLLDAASTSEGWYTWPSWFKGLGFIPSAMRTNLRCSLYTDSINAALQGCGISLGWGRLVEHLLDSGELVRLEPFVMRPKEAYYLVVPHGRVIDHQVRTLVQWLQLRVPALSQNPTE